MCSYDFPAWHPNGITDSPIDCHMQGWNLAFTEPAMQRKLAGADADEGADEDANFDADDDEGADEDANFDADDDEDANDDANFDADDDEDANFDSPSVV